MKLLHNEDNDKMTKMIGGLNDWRNGGLNDWRNGGLNDWRNGGLGAFPDEPKRRRGLNNYLIGDWGME